MAIAVTAGPTRATMLWNAEIGRLLEDGPTLPASARTAVRRVLASLLDEPCRDAADARDIREALDALAGLRAV